MGKYRVMAGKRSLWVVVVALATLVAAPVAPAAARANCMNETIVLTTFHVQMEALKQTYRIGDTAKIAVQVTRPAHHDPLGAGVEWGEPPESFAAEEVNVGVGLQVNGVFLPGFTVTNQEGKGVAKIKIQNYVPQGVAAASVLAWMTQANTPCLAVEEQGFTFNPAIFKVTR